MTLPGAEDVLFTELVGFPNVVHVSLASARLDEIVGRITEGRKQKLDFLKGYQSFPIYRISWVFRKLSASTVPH